MPRETGDAWWEWQPDPDGPVSSRYDEEEMDFVGECGDYALVGSVPLTIWDLMVLKAERVSGLVESDIAGRLEVLFDKAR